MTSDGAGLLITADELASALSGAPAGAPSVLDVRWRLGGPPGVDIYVAGHVPEAVFIDLDRDLAGPPGPGGRHPMPATAAFEAAMRDALAPHAVNGWLTEIAEPQALIARRQSVA